MELVLVQHLIISCGLNSEVPVYKAVVVDLLKNKPLFEALTLHRAVDVDVPSSVRDRF